tara:strand:+ start:4182 stop:4634 length:453 start_codon:yes stop_codon:yes gene_type:complete
MLLRPFCLMLVLLLAGCSSAHQQRNSLYAQLGEQQGITRIVDYFLAELAGDDDVLPMFANTNIERFREKLIEQLCFLADGPCEYTGDSMRDVHRGMDISHAQFNSVVDDLIRAMERQGVAVRAQNALLQRLAALYGEVVREAEPLLDQHF